MEKYPSYVSDNDINIEDKTKSNYINYVIYGVICGVIIFLIIKGTSPDPDETTITGLYRIFGSKYLYESLFGDNNLYNKFKSSASSIHKEYKDIKNKTKVRFADNNDPIQIYGSQTIEPKSESANKVGSILNSLMGA